MDPGDGRDFAFGPQFFEILADGDATGSLAAGAVDFEGNEGNTGFERDVDATADAVEHDVVDAGIEVDDGGFVLCREHGLAGGNEGAFGGILGKAERGSEEENHRP